MYKLLVVEDEKEIANGIVNSLPWRDWGFEICGVCANGVEALEVIGQEPPDLVLSDIRMPKMDGVELMQYISRHYPNIRMIILSGYSDFEYLQTAIKNGICEYLLKPTDIDEFENVFRKMYKRLEEEGKRKTLFAEGQRLKEVKKYNSYLKGYGYDEGELEREFYDGEENRFGVLYFHIDDFNGEDKKTYYLMKNRLAETLEAFRAQSGILGKFFLNYEEQVTGVLMTSDDDEALKAYVSDLQNYAQNHIGMSLSVGVSNFYMDFQMLPQCYQQAKCCGNQQIFSEKTRFIMYYKEIVEEDFNYYTISFDADKMMQDIRQGNARNITEKLESIFSAFHNRIIPDYDYINRLCLELMFNLSRKLLRNSVQLEKVMAEMNLTYSDIYEQESLEDKRDFLYRILIRASEECQVMRIETKKRSSLAAAIKELIDKEYDSNSISLDYAAGKLNKNSAYISKIFKNEFECNFSTYVTQKRLEKSLELLREPALKIYEISESLGWADVSNYIKAFRKRYGMSPNEYRGFAEIKGDRKL